MINGLGKMSYLDRLRECQLLPLEKRRVRGDLIETFKIMNGIDRIARNKFFELNTGSRTRGHKFKLAKQRSRLEIRRNYFSQRVVNNWNKLPDNVINASTVNTFKNRLDKFDLYV